MGNDVSTSEIRISPSGIKIGNIVSVGFDGVKIKPPEKGVFLYQQDNKVIYCEDGKCEKFRCYGRAGLWDGLPYCGETLFVRRDNSMPPISKP
jgi:hypothetical protein